MKIEKIIEKFPVDFTGHDELSLEEMAAISLVKVGDHAFKQLSAFFDKMGLLSHVKRPENHWSMGDSNYVYAIVSLIQYDDILEIDDMVSNDIMAMLVQAFMSIVTINDGFSIYSTDSWVTMSKAVYGDDDAYAYDYRMSISFTDEFYEHILNKLKNDNPFIFDIDKVVRLARYMDIESISDYKLKNYKLDYSSLCEMKLNIDSMRKTLNVCQEELNNTDNILKQKCLDLINVQEGGN